jgi:large subunit ribosomal protein L9
MEIILKQPVKGLGDKDDIVTVRPGYARNYLIPQGYAILGTASNKKILAEIQRQQAKKREQLKQDAQDLAQRLEGLTLEIRTKAGETGKIFGAITALQVSAALKDKGIEVDRRQIEMPDNIKMLGEYQVVLNLHREVKPAVAIKVEAE